MTTPLFEAVVHVGAQETRYESRGRGEPLLLITLDDAERRRLIDLLCPRYRVIAVIPAAPHAAFVRHGPPAETAAAAASAWLCGVTEGLGLEAPRVVLTRELAAFADAAAAVTGNRVHVLDVATPDAAVVTRLEQQHSS
jgi:hypothetical protein